MQDFLFALKEATSHAVLAIDHYKNARSRNIGAEVKRFLKALSKAEKVAKERKIQAGIEICSIMRTKAEQSANFLKAWQSNLACTLLEEIVALEARAEHTLNQTLETVASEKGKELEHSTGLCFRFMNIFEFEKMLSHGTIGNNEAIRSELSFSSFRNLSLTYWADLIRLIILWDHGADSHVHYAELVKSYQECLRISKKQSINGYEDAALRMFRFRLIEHFFNLTPGSLMPEIEKHPEILGYYKQRYLEMVKGLKMNPEFRNDAQAVERQRVILGLFDDPDYLITYRVRLRDIIIHVCLPDRHAPDILKSDTDQSYHLQVYFRTACHELHGAGWTMDGWGTLRNNPIEHILGVLVIVPSRQMCEQIVALIQDVSKQKVTNAFSVYTSTGIRFWPRT